MCGIYVLMDLKEIEVTFLLMILTFKKLISCLQVFSDNGTIFGINIDMVVYITENSDFLSALELASDKKAEIINGRVVLSGTTKDGDKKEYKI